MRKGKSPFWDKIRFKYRLSVLNENTLEEAWHVRLSRFSVFMWACILLIVTFVLLAGLILITPIKHYLPGYGDESVRMQLLEESMRIDSMTNQMQMQETYLTVLKNIIAGDVVSDSVISLDSIALQEREKLLLEKSKIEQDFTASFEEKEKYNLSLFEEKQDVRMYVFFKPAEGIVSSSFAPDQQQYGISIVTSANENVVSVLAGTVIYAAYTLDDAWVMMIQHENDYISVYKNNSQLLKKVGNNVRAGETIAIVANTKENEPGMQIYFELWQKGTPINPEDVIAF